MTDQASQHPATVRGFKFVESVAIFREQATTACGVLPHWVLYGNVFAHLLPLRGTIVFIDFAIFLSCARNAKHTRRKGTTCMIIELLAL